MLLLAVACSYMLGCIPSGLILSRMLGGTDLRTSGSGNIGASNAFRTGGTVLGIMTFLGDFLKGVAAIVLARMLVPDMPAALWFAAYAVLLGHMYPATLGFKGGKGVATFFGVLTAASPVLGYMAVLLWLVTCALTRVASIASFVTLFVLMGFFALYESWVVTILWTGLILCIVHAHRKNIRRLVKGEEKRV
jgi:glycerol-3-phosphate acyltransferase PlsY